MTTGRNQIDQQNAGAVSLRTGLCARALSALLFAFVVTLAMAPSSARAWWNDDWALRKKITIDTSSSGANITDPIGGVPVLVRLHVGNFRFAQTKEDGSDLRFVAGDDKTPLKHHIDRFDSLLGEALVWVRVPELKPGAKADIWLYYGNKKAVAANDAKGTYDSDTALVYHFNERGAPAQDSSAWANGSQTPGQPADGAVVGLGVRFDGQRTLTLPASPSLAAADNGQLTWSAWIKPSALQSNAALYGRHDGTNGLVIGLDNGSPFVEVTNAGSVQRSAGGLPVAPGGWHRVAMTATPGLITLYLDGNAYATLNATLPALNTVAMIGGDTASAAPAPAVSPAAPSPDTSSGPATPERDGAAAPTTDAATPDASTPAAPVAAMAGFAGDMDELEIAKVARPAGFIKLQAIGQGSDQAKLISFSVDEETASWLSGYFGVLLRAVTFDGWVLIGILMIMAVASWVVMVEKNSYLGRQNKANTAFIDDFRRLKDDLTLLSDRLADDANLESNNDAKAKEKVSRYSSLYRIYQIGADEIRRRFPDDAAGSTHILTAESIAAIRSSLDAGLVREMQALNRLMVVLTISISGGPFLGLLGTVIGVMITFAAIAMSGDVNINAIAPGVAGALMATVAGLAVAIPALFGYNWLVLRIKDLTSDMQVFVDQFTTKMAEVYGPNRPGPAVHRMAAE